MAGEGLGRLCSGGGWTYGALWCNDCRDPRLFVLEESYHEEHSGKIFEKVVNQVHVIGQGTIGEVAISGKHRWINFDSICMESIDISSSVDPDEFQGSAEWQDQILAGIKTIALIPLPSLGVLQFGSTQKIRESSDFIAQAQHFLWQFRIKQREYVHVDMNFSHPQATFDSVISSLDYSRFKNNVSSHDNACKQIQDNHFYSECSSLGTRAQTNSPKPHAFSMPVSTSSGSFNGHGNMFYGTPSFSSTSYQVIDQQAASTKARILLPPINGELHSNFNCSNNLFAASFKSNMRAKDIDSSSYMENKFFPGKAMPGVFNMIPTTSHSSLPHSDAFHFLSENSVLPHSKDQNAENSILIHSNSKSTSHQIHNNFMNNPIQSYEETNDQLNKGIVAPAVYNFPDFRIASSDMAGNVSIACTVTSALPITATESPAVCVASSLDRGCDWNVSASDARNQLVSDNDLFDGMELDLSPMISRRECWDDMVLPVVGNGCADFNSGLSNCVSDLEMSSVAGCSGKGLFSASSSFEQLLDAVVAGNANVSTSCKSVGTMNSVICQDSRHHMSTTIKHGDAQIPALSQFKCDIEKTMQGSPLDAQQNLHVHTRIDDSCSVNAAGSALHQPKKQEESSKVVRKRARPGESTRPRPKDRQQIQDRVKELREIVPNGAKCSIDSLLDRTIKHMLFLQSVTKYVDKLKQADEPKLIGKESGVVLKDNTNGGVGGATWAYEVAGQTMVCPILVEDVHPSGQMLVEMLCEERGIFLEIADVVRGFGLTILKGDMEIRERKVWARFLVEANRDVTRMDIFLSLVQFLQQASSFRASEPHTWAISTGINSLTACQQQSPAPIPIGLVDKLH